MVKVKKFAIEITKKIYRLIFCRKSLYKLNLFIYKMSLHGIGILNFENKKLSGEKKFIKSIGSKIKRPVVFDVGANEGEYSKEVKSSNNASKIYAFEPHPENFKKLDEAISGENVHKIRAACGSNEGQIYLYDHDEKGSRHATPVEGVMENIHGREKKATKVKVKKIDHFVNSKEINRIDILKIDTEGYEMEVMIGAKEAIKRGRVRCIQFEFNEMNVESRVFAKDIVKLLKKFSFFRMMPDGLVRLGEYNPWEYEIFAFQNIVAVRQDDENIVKDLL